MNDLELRGDVQEDKSIDDDFEIPPEKSRKDYLLMVLKTIVLFISWCCLGLYAEVLGPSLQTYINMTGTNTEEISQCYSLREVGMFFGSLVGAFLADRFIRYRHFSMIATLLIGAATIVSVPFCFNVKALAATLFFSGFAHGAMTANGNPLLNSIWMEKSGGPFNFMHSGYGVGAAIAPAMLAPYTHDSYRLLPNGSSEKTTLIELLVPYSIVAGLCCFAACLFGLFQCFPVVTSYTQSEKGSTIEKEITPSSTDDFETETVDSTKSKKRKPKCLKQLKKQKKVLIYIVIPTFLLFGALVGNERVFSKFYFIFANEGPAQLSKDDCLLLSGVYWIVFALARVITVPASLIIPLPIIFTIQLIGAWSMALGLYLGPTTLTAYLAFTVCFGLFKSPLFPTALGVISLATPVTGVIVFFVNLGSSLGAAALQRMAGMVMHRQGNHTFPFLVMVTGAVLIFIGLSLIATTHYYKKKYGSTAQNKQVKVDAEKDGIILSD